MRKDPMYKYEDDLDTFFRELARPAGQSDVQFTMNQVGSAMIMDNCIFDMEGISHEFREFSDEQLALLQQYNNDGKHYHFLCYSDIPAPVMRIMAIYADLHPEAATRMQLWKLGRSGIKNQYIMDICCCVLDAGLNLADFIIIKDEDIKLLELHQEQARMLGLGHDAIILKLFNRSGRDRREPVINYVNTFEQPV